MTAPQVAAAGRGDVVRALAGVARDTAHLDIPDRGTARCVACGRDEAVLADRADAAVVRHGDAVAKAHADGTDPTGHRARLAVAAHPLLDGILLPPLRATAGDVHGRFVTAWPYGTPVDPEDPDAAPWEHVAELLARLHAVPLTRLPAPLPAMRGPLKVTQAVARMRAAGPHPAARDIGRAWQGLPAWARAGDSEGAGRPARTAPEDGGPVTLCHGDLHLGQLVRHPASGPWLLIDVDDVGTGDPAWDLARPAAWFAAGLLAPEVWARFLGAYRSAGGPAVPAGGDPWPRLDTPARALTVQTAALAVAKAVEGARNTDEVEELVIDACVRISTSTPTDRRRGTVRRPAPRPRPPAGDNSF